MYRHMCDYVYVVEFRHDTVANVQIAHFSTTFWIRRRIF